MVGDPFYKMLGPSLCFIRYPPGTLQNLKQCFTRNKMPMLEDIPFSITPPQIFTLTTHSLNTGEKSHEVFTYSFVLGSSSLVNHCG
jgi:hypothetical protein